jgi:threonine dehydratase
VGARLQRICVKVPLVLAFTDIELAAARLRGVAHRTPVLRSRLLDGEAGAELHLKAEPLQRTGSFKFRGAYNHVSALPADVRARGVVTASSGNHAQAVALAARLHGIRCVVLMPEDAPAGKRAATEGYGAEVVTFDRYATDRDALLASYVEDSGMHPVHAYDHPLTMAGQGTAALELLEDAGALEVLVVPTGGGGLLGGCATVARHIAPRIRVVGVEPESRPAMREALQVGRPVTRPVARTIADGQQSASVGAAPLAAAQRYVDDIVGVRDEDIVAAMRLAFERLKLVVEPSGASALAAVLSGRVDARGKRVGVVLSGGNVDADRFKSLV